MDIFRYLYKSIISIKCQLPDVCQTYTWYMPDIRYFTDSRCAIGSDWSSSCNSAFTLQAFKTSKIKNLKRSNFGQFVFFREQNALCGKTGGAIIGLLVSEQVGMVFSSSPTRLSLLVLVVRVNPPISTQFWCRNQKIWGKRISSLKSTVEWKSQIMDGVCWIMISHQPTDGMWQNRHIFPQQNHTWMKILSKKCRALGLHS